MLADFASKIDPGSGTDSGKVGTINVDGDYEAVAKRNDYKDEAVTDDDDNNNCDLPEPDGTDDNHDTQNAADNCAGNIGNDCIIEWQSLWREELQK